MFATSGPHVTTSDKMNLHDNPQGIPENVGYKKAIYPVVVIRLLSNGRCKMKVLLVVAAVIAAASAVSYKDVLVQEFNLFKAEYKKSYDNPLENIRRMELFMESKSIVAQHNLRYQRGEETYDMEINEFSDWTPEELENRNGFNKDLRDRMAAGEDVEFPDFDGEVFFGGNVTAPSAINWVEKGAVTAVQDQGRCGSCYAFSALGSLESLHYIKHKKLNVLSYQQIVDCSRKQGNQGCSGGTTGRTYTHVKESGGVNSGATYPYEGKVGQCRFDPKKIAATCNGHVRVANNEDALKEAVATIGPISICIHAMPSLNRYRSGVYSEPSCRSDIGSLNHGVVVVGYGVDSASKQPYWLVKNSWGSSWGDKGYVKMAMNKNNMCGVASYGLYPKL